MKKKVLIAMITVTLLSIFLTSCGKKENGNNSTTDNTVTEENENDRKDNSNENTPENSTGAYKGNEGNTTDEKNEEAVSGKFYTSESAGYIGRELLRVDFKAVTHAQAEDMKEYFSSMEEMKKFSHSSLIPSGLCDLIIKAMDEGTEEKTFAPIKTDNEISQEEFTALTGKELENTEAVFAVKVDADNDGTEDIVGEYYYGGTGGFSGMQMYKGSPDGKYTLTSSFECISQAFDFIRYEGKNYLLLEEFDYNTKCYSGYSLYLYEDGKLADGKLFYFVIDDYDLDVKYEDSSYEDINTVKNTLCNTKLPDILENGDGVITGNAETVNKSGSYFTYACDIDNDGDQEYYTKYMWYPSNMGTVMRCMYDFEDSLVLDDLCGQLSEETGNGLLYTFWLDNVNGKNLMYLYYGNNLDFTLYAFLINTGE